MNNRARAGARIDLKALDRDPKVCSSCPWHDQTLTKREESRKLFVFPGVGINEVWSRREEGA